MKTRKIFSQLISFSLLVMVMLAGCAPAAPASVAATTSVAPAVATQPPTGVSTTPAPEPTKQPTAIVRSGPKEIILATTTSTRDSGLLDALVPVFEKASGFSVKTIAVGSGQALQMGKDGNADVLLVHSPAAEKETMATGAGKERLLVMHNDFIVVGPQDDPAKIKGTQSPVEAFKTIATSQTLFLSRGDKSGTNTAELAIWKKAGITPSKADAWYIQTGQSMGETLRITSEKGGYTLSDRATYLAQKASLALAILVEGDASLLNVYHVITVNPEKWPLVNKAGAVAFAQFMVSPETQKLIGEFGKEKFQQSLFFPDADKTDKDLGLE